ncbi:LysR family transcriptional regulator [Litorisediminicola beolgyonensis]|uniref:LysR family transcriptional regulator n=1 Tax=Litorisediminicola beolgyonensis TaxID=1173614 RepID=A0ABW3ZLH6_9RHOB
MLNALWLETFTELCETGHFTRTAAKLGMTQPGVSQHLRKLEAQLGTALIARDGKGFVLTAAGEEVLALGRARREEERALRDRIGTDDPDSGEASIACSGSFATLLYPQILDLMASRPGLVVHLVAAPRSSVMTRVGEGTSDFGIVEGAPEGPRLDTELLGREETCLVLPQGDVPDEITLAALDARGLIGHPDAEGYADALFGANFGAAYRGVDRLRLRGSVNQIGQITAPVARGIGYTVLPRSGVEAASDAGRLACPALAERCYRELWLVWRRGRPLSARLEKLAGLIRDTAKRVDAS